MCDMNCFNCKYEDCINDTITDLEIAEQNMYDRIIISKDDSDYKKGKFRKRRKEKMYYGQERR